MGKPTGFMEYDRVDSEAFDPKERIKILMNFIPRFHLKNSVYRLHAVWIAEFLSASQEKCSKE